MLALFYLFRILGFVSSRQIRYDKYLLSKPNLEQRVRTDAAASIISFLTSSLARTASALYSAGFKSSKFIRVATINETMKIPISATNKT
jgi:hypothetical protein